MLPGCNAQATTQSLLGIYDFPWTRACSARHTSAVSPLLANEPPAILFSTSVEVRLGIVGSLVRPCAVFPENRAQDFSETWHELSAQQG